MFFSSIFGESLYGGGQTTDLQRDNGDQFTDLQRDDGDQPRWKGLADKSAAAARRENEMLGLFEVIKDKTEVEVMGMAKSTKWTKNNPTSTKSVYLSKTGAPHLVDLSWRDFSASVRSHQGWSARREKMTEQEKVEFCPKSQRRNCIMYRYVVTFCRDNNRNLDLVVVPLPVGRGQRDRHRILRVAAPAPATAPAAIPAPAMTTVTASAPAPIPDINREKKRNKRKKVEVNTIDSSFGAISPFDLPYDSSPSTESSDSEAEAKKAKKGKKRGRPRKFVNKR